MVWCWQQAVDLRPTASGITAVAKMDQFLRLADAIRVNNFGSQVRERRERPLHDNLLCFIFTGCWFVLSYS